MMKNEKMSKVVVEESRMYQLIDCLSFTDC